MPSMREEGGCERRRLTEGGGQARLPVCGSLMKAAGFVAQESGLDRHAHVPACVAPLCKRSPETYGQTARIGERPEETARLARPSRTQSARTQRAQVELWVTCDDTEWSAPSEACFFVGVRLECSHPSHTPSPTHCGCSREPGYCV